jgi:hypothetical protein
MNRESEDLKQRIAGLTDDQLLQMVTVEANEYRPEAIDFAKAELTARGVDFTQETETPDTVETPVASNPLAGSPRSPAVACAACGGAVRTGTLVGEKELTVVFGDSREERFLRVIACTQCNQVSLFVDFETDVE